MKKKSLFARRRLVLVAGAAMNLFVTSAVSAQEVPLPDLPPLQPRLYIGDTEGQVEMDVRRRHRPAFDPVGIPIGNWRLYPSLGADVGYESNLFGDEHDPVSAALVDLRPAASFEADPSWGQMRFDASGQLTRFIDHPQANENSFTVATYTRYELGDQSMIEIGADAGQQIERRDSSGFPDGRVEPVRYFQTQVYGRASHEGGDLRLVGAVDFTRFNFQDTRALAADGTVLAVVDQDVRDQRVLRGDLRADYTLSPGISLFARGIVQSVNYRVAYIAPGVPNLDGKTYTALGGVALGGAGLLRGTIGLGYVWRDFGGGSAAPNISGLAINADVAYFATPILTLSAQASRTVEEAVLQDASGYTSTSFGVGADYELRRWLIIHANANFRYNDFRINPRTDKVFNASIGATYNVDRHVAFDGSMGYVKRNVDNDPFAASYDDFVVRVGARYAF
ncbi:MAG: outer membrane beta-barrel protein [Sphingomonas sp.]